jgi:hypothetical protein
MHPIKQRPLGTLAASLLCRRSDGAVLGQPECRALSTGGIDSGMRVCDLTQPYASSLASNDDMTSRWMMTNEEASLADSPKAVSRAELRAESLVIEDRNGI